MSSESTVPQVNTEDIPSDTPCDVCGKPAAWLVHPPGWTLCDDHYADDELLPHVIRPEVLDA